MTELLTERLRLRRARPEDLAALHEVFSDPAAMRYWSSLPHQDMALTAAYLDAMLAPPGAVSDQFIVEHAGRVIGRVGMWMSPEIGFILHSKFWGRGLGVEAVAAFITYAFAAHQIEALTADVDPRNAASLKLLTGLGFRETGRAEGTFLLGDQWCDSVYLALQGTDWTARL